MTWTEDNGVWTLERGGVEVAHVDNVQGRAFGDGNYWAIIIGGHELETKHPTASFAKQVVEEILSLLQPTAKDTPPSAGRRPSNMSLLQPKAKELVWDFDPYGDWRACVDARTYRVRFILDKGLYFASAQRNNGNDRELSVDNTLEAAQAACQSHFNALVQEMIG